MKRIIAAFLIAPGIFPLGLTLFSQNDMAITGALVYAMFTYPLAIIIGVPALLFFKAWGFDKWWQFCLAAGLVGFIPSLFFLGTMGLSGWLILAASFIGIGTLSGYVFWFIGFWKTDKIIKC
jgi:hypothetical protein